MIAFHYLFVDMDDAHVKHRTRYLSDILNLQLFLNLADAKPLFLFEQHHHHGLSLGEFHPLRRAELFVERYHRLALRLQSGRYCRFIHLPNAA